jgi:hypothetical protein
MIEALLFGWTAGLALCVFLLLGLRKWKKKKNKQIQELLNNTKEEVARVIKENEDLKKSPPQPRSLIVEPIPLVENAVIGQPEVKG